MFLGWRIDHSSPLFIDIIMTEQEQQLLKNILLWEHEKAPELAMLLVKGIDLEDLYWKGSFRLAKQFLPQAINDCTNNTRTTPIPSNTFLDTSWNGMINHLGGSLNDLALFYILYSLYPDSYQEVETLDVFKPERGRVRIQKLLKGCSISDKGKPQLSNWYNEYTETNAISFFLHLIGECPEALHVDESLRRRNITKLAVSDMGLKSLSILQKLTSLTKLDCSENQLTTLDVSQNGELTELRCRDNQLTTLDVSQNGELTELRCGYNQLTTLDVSQNRELTVLWCGYNQLTTLDVSQNRELTELDCSENQLTTLDVSQNGELTELRCRDNQLTTLDVSQNRELTRLWCYRNQLTTLDVSQNGELTGLWCKFNQLTTLDVSQNRELTELWCGYNQLTTLDVSQNGELTGLWCSENQLTTLDVSQNRELTGLDCSRNQLTTLDVSQNRELTELNCSGNQLSSEEKQQIQAQFPFAEV